MERSAVELGNRLTEETVLELAFWVPRLEHLIVGQLKRRLIAVTVSGNDFSHVRQLISAEVIKARIRDGEYGVIELP